MEKRQVFLASSCELEADRRAFEIFIARQNKIWYDKGVYFELVIWEDFLDKMSQTRLQDEYNKAIKACDIFVMLFATKVGKYTKEEFKTAFGKFKKTNKPFIYTYFKDMNLSLSEINMKDFNSLKKFQKKLDKLGHFYTTYKSIEGLREHFGNQLTKLAQNDLLEMPKPSKEENEKTKTNSPNNQIYTGIKDITLTNNSTTQTNTGAVGGDMVGGDKTTK
jgi:hypothetical protein